MSIRQLDNQQSSNTSLVPNAVSACFVMPIIGSVGAGKSTVLTNLLTSTSFYKQKFHKIVFISCTADMDEKVQAILNSPDICISNQKLQDEIDREAMELDDEYEPIELPKYHGIDPSDIYEIYTPDILPQLSEHQKYIIKSYSKEVADRVLVVIDDAITSGAYKAGHQDSLARFATSLRHVKCSLIHCSQLWKAAPKVVRTQSTCGVFCGVPNEIEIRDIYENFSCGIPLQRWLELFYIVVNKPFQPVVFNLLNKRGCKMQRGFEEYIA